MELYKFNPPTVFFSYFCMHALILDSCLGLRMSGNETDWLALLEIKARITADPHAVLTSWNETMHALLQLAWSYMRWSSPESHHVEI